MKAQQKNLKKVHKGKWIPNALTISRLVFAVAIVLVLLIKPYGWSVDQSLDMMYGIGIQWSFYYAPLLREFNVDFFESVYYVQFLVAGLLFVLGCLTDFLDGFLSRKFNWVSDFGKIMDPVADKVLVDATLIVLCVLNAIYVWIVILIVARDILVDATRMVKAKEGKVVPANIWGKCKTVFQMLGVMLIVFVFNKIYFVEAGSGLKVAVTFEYMYNPVTAIANIGLYLALIFSLTSGIIYEVQMLSKPKQQKAK